MSLYTLCWEKLLKYLEGICLSKCIQRVGFDIGGCLVPSCNDRSDVQSLPPPFTGVRPVMELLKSKGVEMFVVSFCGKKTAHVSYDWLVAHSIVDKYIPSTNVYFCDGDKDVDKALLVSKLQLDMFVDDRISILRSMEVDNYKRLVLKQKDNVVCGKPDADNWIRLVDMLPLVKLILKRRNEKNWSSA